MFQQDERWILDHFTAKVFTEVQRLGHYAIMKLDGYRSRKPAGRLWRRSITDDHVPVRQTVFAVWDSHGLELHRFVRRKHAIELARNLMDKHRKA